MSEQKPGGLPSLDLLTQPKTTEAPGLPNPGAIGAKTGGLPPIGGLPKINKPATAEEPSQITPKPFGGLPKLGAPSIPKPAPMQNLDDEIYEELNETKKPQLEDDLEGGDWGIEEIIDEFETQQEFENSPLDEDYEASLMHSDGNFSIEEMDEDMPEEMDGFLPTFNDEEDEPLEEEILPQREPEEVPHDEPRDNDGEFDETKIKEFFENLKNKIFKPKKSKPSGKLKNNKKPSIVGKILKILIPLIIIAGAVFLVFTLVVNKAPKMSAYEGVIESETHKIAITNVVVNDGVMTMDIENQFDMVTQYSVETTMETKALFGDTVGCYSYIDTLDLGEKRTITMICDTELTEVDYYNFEAVID